MRRSAERLKAPASSSSTRMAAAPVFGYENGIMNAANRRSDLTLLRCHLRTLSVCDLAGQLLFTSNVSTSVKQLVLRDAAASRPRILAQVFKGIVL